MAISRVNGIWMGICVNWAIWKSLELTWAQLRNMRSIFIIHSTALKFVDTLRHISIHAAKLVTSQSCNVSAFLAGFISRVGHSVLNSKETPALNSQQQIIILWEFENSRIRVLWHKSEELVQHLWIECLMSGKMCLVNWSALEFVLVDAAVE